MPHDAQILELSIDRISTTPDSLPSGHAAKGTRRRILLSGLDQFADRGYHATSIRDIAAGADLQSASLYRHFASKEAILADLVLIAHEVLHEALIAALLTAGAEPQEQLRRVMAAHVTMHARWWKLARVATREAQHLAPEATVAATTLKASAAGILHGIVTEGQRQGVFVVDDLELTLTAIAWFGVAVADWYPVKPHTATPEQIGDTYAELTLNMVGAHA